MCEYQMVHELPSWEDGWTIKVKVLKRWGAFDTQGLRVMNFILVDENGCRISAYVGNLNLSYFKYVLQEGNWVQLSKFKLIPSKWEERTTRHIKQIILDGETKKTTHHKWRIFLLQNTTVKRLSEIPTDTQFMSFSEFEDILDGTIDHKYPIDLLGDVVHVGRLTRIKDYGLDDWRIAYNNGTLTVSDARGMSRFLFDPHIVEVDKFKDRYFKSNKMENNDIEIKD
ncbi:uncharacterized protein LOC112083454 [Eutrema salsugineum]|uniref:uncharacterized protein LOC112083454 n=1 Tax=Eutrema salsugineum TaxID=72664 RepID=UPI000CED1265|nr:uncharacterized protein LOC112083454 [Eutrema salsugineum]